MAPLAKSFNFHFFPGDLINVRFPRVISPEDRLLARAFAENYPIESVTPCPDHGRPRVGKKTISRPFYLAGYSLLEFFL